MINVKMEKNIENELSLSYQELVNQYVSTINYKLDSYQTLLTNVSSDLTIIDLLSNEKKTNLFDAGEKITREVGFLLGAKGINELYNIMIYNLNESNTIYGSKITNISAIDHEKWFKYIQRMKGTNGLFQYKGSSSTGIILSFVKFIYGLSDEQYGRKLGVVKLDVKTEPFFGSNLDFKNNQDVQVFILNGSRVMFSNSRNQVLNAPGLMKRIYSEESGIQFAKMKGENVILIFKSISQYGLKSVFIFHYGEINKRRNEIKFFIVTFAFITTLLVICFTMVFSRKFSRRVKRLILKMEKVENGNLDITESDNFKDEFGIVDDHFNNMVEKIQNLINMNYIQQLENKEAELKALQLQINPHFLYNTLESINAMAAIEHCYEIGEVSQKLGEIFRYSINTSRSEYVALEQELSHIENYIYIQKVRFKDRFEVFYNVEEAMKSYQVMRFILQPIVENAILHGFGEGDHQGTIEIAACQKEQQLVLKIMDDGRGMTMQQVEDLNTFINRKSENMLDGYERSIGIKNVNMRIKLAYGEPYGVFIESKLHSGTQVTIKLPLHDFGEV